MVFLWVSLYGVTYMVSENIILGKGMYPWILPVNMLVYTLLLILWIWRSGMHRNIGFVVAETCSVSKWIEIIPVFILPVYNLLMARGADFSLYQILLMFSVSVTEEIFFRGFLLHMLIKHSRICGIILSSIVFSLLHGANVFQGADFDYTWMQMICAFSSGICYSIATVQTGSLLPAIVAHILTNITGIAEMAEPGWKVSGLWVMITLHIWWGIHKSCEIYKIDKEIRS